MDKNICIWIFYLDGGLTDWMVMKFESVTALYDFVKEYFRQTPRCYKIVLKVEGEPYNVTIEDFSKSSRFGRSEN